MAVQIGNLGLDFPLDCKDVAINPFFSSANAVRDRSTMDAATPAHAPVQDIAYAFNV
jgi:hypothetical protein